MLISRLHKPIVGNIYRTRAEPNRFGIVLGVRPDIFNEPTESSIRDGDYVEMDVYYSCRRVIIRDSCKYPIWSYFWEPTNLFEVLEAKKQGLIW